MNTTTLIALQPEGRVKEEMVTLQRALDAAHEECNTLRADLAAALTQLTAERQKSADLAAIVRDAGRQISRLLDICDALERRMLDQEGA
jgi:ABC-type transporter Mla subunit MlaD